MELAEFCSLMDDIAPRELALAYDNVGLLIEPDHRSVKRVLLALDLTTQTAREAVELGADLLLTHHPSFFHGTKSMAFSSPVTGAAALLIRHGIGHFAAHTNLDAAPGGVNDTLCRLLGLTDVAPWEPGGMGRVGLLPKPLTLRETAALCGRELATQAAFGGDPEQKVSSLAVLGGAGGGELALAQRAGADALLTGEAHHHDIVEARERGMGLILCGHYETECVVLKSLYDRLQNAADDVQYFITVRETAPLLRS